MIFALGEMASEFARCASERLDRVDAGDHRALDKQGQKVKDHNFFIFFAVIISTPYLVSTGTGIVYSWHQNVRIRGYTLDSPHLLSLLKPIYRLGLWATSFLDFSLIPHDVASCLGHDIRLERLTSTERRLHPSSVRRPK